AMGTGTYGLSIVQHVAAQAEKYGPGAVADAVTSVANRLYGIELQSGPFSVAELRLSQAIQEFGGQLPENGMHLYVADTLEDPQSGTNRELSYTLQLIAQQRQRANRVILETPIQVCIGNPPYKDKSEGLGGWVEKGSTNSNHTPLDDFRKEGNGRYEYVLKTCMSIFGVGRCGKSLKASPIPQMVWSALLQRLDILTALDLRECASGYVVIPHAVGLLISPQKENSHLQKTPYSTSKSP